MTTTPAIQSIDIATPKRLMTRSSWLWLGLIGILFSILFRNFLVRMALIAMSRWGGDWSHALVIPLIAGWYVYQQQGRLDLKPRKISGTGLAVLFMGIFSYAWWIYPGRNDMLQGYSMIIALFGLVLFLQGWSRMRILWFPVAYMIFAVKVSDRIWEQIAWKLQLIAAEAATAALNFFGVFLKLEASVTGSTIRLSFEKDGQWIVEVLNVAEACSGLRMLAAFMALGVAVAFLADRAWWQRWTLVVLTLPIAVAVNVGRVTALGLLHLVDKQWAAGDVHTFVGMLMLIPALLGFLCVAWILDQLILQDDESLEMDACSDAVPDEQTSDDDLQDQALKSSEEPDSLPARSQTTAEQSLVSRWRIMWGLGAGLCLALLIGLSYGLFLACFRPHLLGFEIQKPLVVGLFCVSVAGLAVGGWGFRRMLRSHGQFVLAQAACVGVLVTAVVGLQTVVGVTKAVLIKKPVPVRQSLVVLPQSFGRWQMIDDERLSNEILEELRTREYISRTYRDTAMPITEPGSTVRLHVAYYTGTPDTVPHVPDRCFVAAGLSPRGKSQSILNMRGPNYRSVDGKWFASSPLSKKLVRIPQIDIPATVFSFGPVKQPKLQSNVIYFFVANGNFLPSPDHVRFGGFSLTDEYSFYCKIEIGVHLVADPELARQRASDFLSEILPQIMACLPDWDDVTEGRWPPHGLDAQR